MGKIIFVIGGARSGKSAFAKELARKNYRRVAFIATCQPLDAQMKARISRHKKERPKAWKTFEENRDIAGCLKKIGPAFDAVLIDCLTLLICNLMLKKIKPAGIEKKVKEMLAAFTKIKADTFIVSNEVGLGIVPQNKLGRDFRDVAGRINQVVAAKSDKVYFMVAGIPWRIK
jgi:adenosylcobinamide kinase/adenosylcobinamide-phosphate guanylyltransferase